MFALIGPTRHDAPWKDLERPYGLSFSGGAARGTPLTLNQRGEVNMPYVTLIHGLSNKPESDYLLELWKRKLATADGVPLDTLGVGSQMVYWADVLYESPDMDLASYESELTGDEALREAAVRR